MQYIIFVPEKNDAFVMHAAPVDADDAAYLQRVTSTLRPLSAEDYINGPAAILQTGARFSYVLHEGDVCWCAEWAPGLIVVRFSPTGEMAWTAVRSPVPDFGGRHATQTDLDAWDEDAANPQYNLVFDPWDAQFDAQERQWKSFTLAQGDVQAAFQRATAAVNALGAALEEPDFDDGDAWIQRCERNLAKWAGEGARLD